MGLSEFEPYLDFWLECQRKGFSGDSPRKKSPDGSKHVTLREGNLLYVDSWYGSDIGGGQTVLYKDVVADPAPKLAFPKQSLQPIARLGYSGEIVRRFTEEEMEYLKPVFGDMSQSEIVWKVLKSALSKVSKERFLRGPRSYIFPVFSDFLYSAEESQDGDNRIRGAEDIILDRSEDRIVFVGTYDFTLIKNNLEDRL